MKYLIKYLVLIIFVWSLFNVSFALCASLDEELLSAVKQGDINVIQALLTKGADVNAKGNKGTTALMYACLLGRLEAVKELLSRGADVNAKNNQGMTALMYASSLGSLELIKELLAKGADVNAKNNIGMTVLDFAGRHYSEVAQVLIPSSMGKEGHNKAPPIAPLKISFVTVTRETTELQFVAVLGLPDDKKKIPPLGNEIWTYDRVQVGMTTLENGSKCPVVSYVGGPKFRNNEVCSIEIEIENSLVEDRKVIKFGKYNCISQK